MAIPASQAHPWRFRVLQRFQIGSAIVFAILFQCVAVSQEKLLSEYLLPPNTKAWLSIPDVDALVKAVEQTSFGRMLEDEKIAPFVQDLTEQIRGWLDEKNVQFGLEIADFEGVPSGEVCVAGILIVGAPGADDVRKPDHATLLLVDITDTKEKALKLLATIEQNLDTSDAEKEELIIDDVKVSKWSIDKPRGLPGKVYAFHGIVGDWLFTCDNERVVRDIIRRIKLETHDAANLASMPTFQKIQEKCGFDQPDRHVRWFVEPFGYLELAQAVALDKDPKAVEGNDIAKIFRREGFDAIKGVGGTVRVFDGKHEAVHRTFIYAPPVAEAGEERYLRAAAMLDFNGGGDSNLNNLSPPDWVPADSATYISFNWNLKKALKKVGYIVESLGAREGSWQKTLDQLRDAPDGYQIDVPLLIEQLEGRISIISATEKPIGEASERVVFGFNILGDPEIVRIHASKLILHLEKGAKTSIVEHGDLELWVMDTTDPLDDIEFDPLYLPSLDEDTEPDRGEMEKPKPLFERRVATVVGNVLLVGNDVEYLKKIIDQFESKPGRVLAAANDYVRIADALTELSLEFEGDSLVRHFGRLDAALETNYEMLRQGKMGTSKTILAQILNQSIDADRVDEPRTQKINPEKMPADYQNDIAPYLGPNGMIVKGIDEGWILLGCVLPRNETVASIAEDDEASIEGESKIRDKTEADQARKKDDPDQRDDDDQDKKEVDDDEGDDKGDDQGDDDDDDDENTDDTDDN